MCKTFIMPAGPLGAVTYYTLKENCHPGKVSGFLDNVKGKADNAEFCGLPVFTPERVPKNSKIILATFRYKQVMTRQLRNLGFQDIINSGEDRLLTLENAALALERIRADGIEQKYDLDSVEIQLQNYLFDANKSDNALTLPKIDIVVTQRCTLKCRDCSTLTQYYANPIDIDINTILRSVDALFTHVDFIRVINIIGGEPLIAKELPLLLEKLATYRRRIGDLMIITNGTVLTDDKTLAAMKRVGLRIQISDYGDLSRNKDELIKQALAADVRCEKRPNFHWVSENLIRDKRVDQELVFNECDAFCANVMDGNLYYCSFAAHGDALRAFPRDANNSVSLLSPETIKETIRTYIERSFALPACGYCTGSGMAREPIPVAVQTPKPLLYKRYD